MAVIALLCRDLAQHDQRREHGCPGAAASQAVNELDQFVLAADGYWLKSTLLPRAV
jgi:hypothetical protein